MKVRIESHTRYGKCRVAENGWVAGRDIARILGYSNADGFVRKHVAKEDKRYEIIRSLDSSHCARTALINKRGVESMLDACANIDADKIKQWLLSIMGEEKPDMTPQVLVPQVFNHPQFGNLRAVLIGGELFFVGKDVAQALDYKEPEKAVREHIPDKFKGVSEMDTPGGRQKVVVINEAGLYKLIMRSRLPEAEKFSDWVCGEVLPSIRQHGFYSVKPLEQVQPAQIDELEKQVARLQDQMAGLEILFQKWLELSPVGQIDKLLDIADKLHEPDAQDKVLLQAVNLILGKKLF